MENPFFSKTTRDTSTRAKSSFQVKAFRYGRIERQKVSSSNGLHAYLLILAEQKFYMYIFIALGTF